MSRIDFIPFDLRERHPEALEEILENRKRINDFWDGISRTLDYTNQREIQGGKYEKLRKNVRRRSSANIQFQEELLTSSLQDKHLFHPLGAYKAAWDLFIALLILYSAVTVPYRIALSIEPRGVAAVMDGLVNYFFLFDIFVAFNTAIVDSRTELLVSNRLLIAKDYLKFWFWIDLISALPFESILLSLGIKSGNLDAVLLLKLLRLTRVFRLLRVLNLGKLGKQLEKLDLNPVCFSALRLILVIWFCAHTFACLWIIVGTEASKRTWMAIAPFGDISMYNSIETYGLSFYWVVYTVMSVGYGEFIPVNKLERVFAMFLELAGGLVFGAVLAQITRVLEISNPHARMYKLKIEELHNYLLERKLPLNLKARITDAFKYYLNTKSVFDEEIIVRELPNVLLTKLVVHTYQKQFNNFAIFKQLEKAFVVNILVSSKPFQAEYGEIVLSNGAVTSEIVFLNRGLVQFSTVSNLSLATVTGYCTDGEYFGDFEYYRKTNRFMSYRAKTNCSLLSIDIRALENAFKLFPVSGKMFHDKVAKRYEQFLKAKASNPKFNENGVCLREELWINGFTVMSKHRLDSRIARRSVENVKRWQSANLVSDYDVDKALQGKNASVRVLSRIEDGSIAVVSEESPDVLLFLGIIPPKNAWKTRWDIFVGLLIIYSVIVVPVEVGFLITLSQPLRVLGYAIDGLFFVDLLLASRTAYYDDANDALVAVPSYIFTRYLKTWFIVDFLSCFPFAAVLSLMFQTANYNLNSLTLLKAVRLLRLVRAVKFGIIAERVREKFLINSYAVDVLKLIVQFLFAAHLIACLYWFMTTVFGSHAWYDDIGLRHAELKSQYITTLYFIVTTLTGVGYGDIYPITPSERTLMTFIFFFGFFITGFVVANVRFMINTGDAAERRVAHKMAEVDGYLAEKSITGPLQELVASQIKHAYKYGSTRTEREILRVLPQFLVNKIISVHHADTLGCITLFQYIDDDNVVLFLFPMLTSRVYTTGDIISSQGSTSTDITFLTKGAADIVRKWKLPAIKKGRRKSRDDGILIRKQNTTTSLSQKISQKLLKLSPFSNSRKSTESNSAKSSYLANSADSSKSSGSHASGYSRRTKLNSLKIRPMSFRGKIIADEPIFKEKILNTVRAPDFFGLVSLVTGTAQSTTVRASMPCTTFTLNELDVRSLIVDNPTVALIVKDALAKAFIGQREKLKDDLRAKRFAFLRECKNNFYNSQDRKCVAAANETKSARYKDRGRRGSFSQKRVSFSTPRRGSFSTRSPTRGSFDTSAAGLSLQKRGSFDQGNRVGLNVISPHSTRRRFNFSEVAGMMRTLSSKAFPFLRGDSNRTNSFGLEANLSQLHPDILKNMQDTRGFAKSTTNGSIKSMASGSSFERNLHNNDVLALPIFQPTRQEIMATIERKSTRKKMNSGKSENINEPSKEANDSIKNSGSSPLSHEALIMGPSKASEKSKDQTEVMASSNVISTTWPSQLLDDTHSPTERAAGPLEGAVFDSVLSNPPSPKVSDEDKARLQKKRSFYLELPEGNVDEEMKDAVALNVGSGESNQCDQREDTLLSIDEKDIATPRTLLTPLPYRQMPKNKVDIMPTIPPSPAVGRHRGFETPGVDTEIFSVEMEMTNRPLVELEDEDRPVELKALVKPRRRLLGDSAIVSILKEDPVRVLTSNADNEVGASDSSKISNVDDVSNSVPIALIPTTNSSGPADDTTPPPASPVMSSPWSRKVKDKILGSSSTRRLSAKSFDGTNVSQKRRNSIGRFAEVVNQASMKSVASVKRASLTTGQIANTFKKVRKKTAFDPGRVEFGLYDSDDDAYDPIDPPVILKSEIQIRRVESAVDLAQLDGKTFKDVVKNKRARRLTFPSTRMELQICKDNKLLQLAT